MTFYLKFILLNEIIAIKHIILIILFINITLLRIMKN